MASKDADLGEQILQILEQKGRLDSYEFSQETSREHQSVVGAIKSLQSVGNVSESTGSRDTYTDLLASERTSVCACMCMCAGNQH